VRVLILFLLYFAVSILCNAKEVTLLCDITAEETFDQKKELKTDRNAIVVVDDDPDFKSIQISSSVYWLIRSVSIIIPNKDSNKIDLSTSTKWSIKNKEDVNKINKTKHETNITIDRTLGVIFYEHLIYNKNELVGSIVAKGNCEKRNKNNIKF
jgi:hypothetical protein